MKVVRIRADKVSLWKEVSSHVVNDSTVVLICEKFYADLIKKDVLRFVHYGDFSVDIYSKMSWYKKIKAMFFLPIISSAIEMMLSSGYVFVDSDEQSSSLELRFSKKKSTSLC